MTAVATEAAWLAWAVRNGVPARARTELPAPYRPCYEVMNDDPVATPGLTVALGQLHAWLHQLPVTGAPGPTVTWAAAVAGIEGDDDLVAGRLARLATTRPGPLTPAPCHGDFTPVTVHLDPGDLRDIVVTGWAGAVVSDREYDVAFTELGLWASPYLTSDRERQPLLKVARSFLLNGYRAGYAAVAGAPDPHRRRLWGAYHACRLLAAPLTTVEPFRSWDPAVADATVAAFRRELAARVDDLLPDPTA